MEDQEGITGRHPKKESGAEPGPISVPLRPRASLPKHKPSLLPQFSKLLSLSEPHCLHAYRQPPAHGLDLITVELTSERVNEIPPLRVVVGTALEGGPAHNSWRQAFGRSRKEPLQRQAPRSTGRQTPGTLLSKSPCPFFLSLQSHQNAVTWASGE